jgi:hypothetical protein
MEDKRIVRDEIKDQEKIRVAKNKIREARDLLKPYGQEPVGTIVLHLYSGLDLLTGLGNVSVITQSVDMNISQEAVKHLIPEIKWRVLEALGGRALKLSPKTVEETQDLGQKIIKTSLDS